MEWWTTLRPADDAEKYFMVPSSASASLLPSSSSQAKGVPPPATITQSGLKGGCQKGSGMVSMTAACQCAPKTSSKVTEDGKSKSTWFDPKFSTPEGTNSHHGGTLAGIVVELGDAAAGAAAHAGVPGWRRGIAGLCGALIKQSNRDARPCAWMWNRFWSSSRRQSPSRPRSQVRSAEL